MCPSSPDGFCKTDALDAPIQGLVFDRDIHVVGVPDELQTNGVVARVELDPLALDVENTGDERQVARRDRNP